MTELTRLSHLFDKLFHNLDHMFIELRKREASEHVIIYGLKK